MKNAISTTNDSGYTDAEMGAMLKDYQRDCRLGHCGHHACRRKADQRIARATRPVAQPEVAFDPGFDVGATLKDYLRDRRLGHFGLHDIGNVAPDLTDDEGDISAPEFEVPVMLRADGSLDKHGMRMQRLFGEQPLWS